MRKLLLLIAIVYFGCNSNNHESEITELLTRAEKADSAGEFDSSATYYSRILDLDCTHMIALQSRGWTYLNLGKYDEAIKDFTKLINDSPSAKAYHDRGIAYADVNEYKKAHEDFISSLKLNQNFVESYYGLSMVNASLGNYRNAMKLCDIADSINYLETYSLVLRAQINCGLGNYKKVIEYEKKMIVREKNSVSIGNHYNNMAFAENMMGKYDAALGHLNLSMGLNPMNPYTYNNKAYALLKTGKAKEALPLVEKSLEMAGDNASAFNTRGQIFLAMNQNEKACDDFKNGISLAIDSILLVELKSMVKRNCGK
jgi:tetratricopeptide (TPR) repeat protein